MRIPEASPLPSADTVPNSHDAIRELIAQEMANSTPQEREVWFDSLKELSLPHAVGVLEMWKLSGRGAPPASPGPLWSSPTLPQEVPSPFFQEMNLSAAPSQIELRARDNLQFAVTPGYKRRRAVAHQTVDGRLVWSTEIDFSPGQHAFTFMPLDWAIEGSEFFVVSHENATYFTRCGHFTLDADHYLALQLGDDYYRLQPEICLPENAQQILIDEKCAVLVKTENNEETIPLTLASFINPAGLEPAGSTLFKATAASGSPLIANASEGTVVQFALEQSNVIPNEEWERIKAHQRLSGLTP